jgi:hypothetical protein
MIDSVRPVAAQQFHYQPSGLQSGDRCCRTGPQSVTVNWNQASNPSSSPNATQVLAASRSSLSTD